MSLGVLHPLGACASGSVALLRGEGARLTVGRAAECSLCLDDKAVSRTHVALFVRGGAAFVQNLRGADFPLFINGQELLGEHALSHGDLLSLPATHGPDHQLRWQELANEATVALPRHPLGVALANAAVKPAAGSTPKKSAPPPPPPPPPARAAGAPPPPPQPPKPPTSAAHHPSVHDLAGGLARLRAVQQQQPAPAAAAPPAPVPPGPALLVVDPHALARARAGLRKTGAAAAVAAAVTPTRRGAPVQPAGGATPTSSRKRQATPPPPAAAAGTPRSALKRLRGTAEPCAARALALPPSAQKAVAWRPYVELQSAETRAVERTQAVDLMEDQVPDATEVLAVLPPAFAQPRRQAAASAAPLRAAAVPAPSPTSLGLPAWMLQSAAAAPAAERVTPLRTHARSGARREPAAIAGEQPDAASVVAAQLLAARGALRRTKALLRASRHRTQLLERALAVAAAAAPMEVLEASASEDAELGGSRVVVCTSDAAPADAARPEGAVRSGSVLVVYAQRAVPPPLPRPAAAAAIVVVAAAPRPLPPAPSPARIVPPWMFKAPKAALVEASSPMPAWLFSPGFAAGGCGAGARAVLGPSPAALAASNVTPRSAQRRKSMAQRAATAAEQHEPEVPECPPVALRFSQPEEAHAPAPLPLALALRASPPAQRPPACAPLRLEASAGADLVGRRVVVWWSLDAAWYPGCIEAFAVRSKKHTVLYDDGEKETISLIKVNVRDEAAHLAAGGGRPEEEAETVKVAAKRGREEPAAPVRATRARRA